MQMIVINTLIGIISIAIMISTLYVIGKVMHRMYWPNDYPPDAAQHVLAGVLALGTLCLVLAISYLIGAAIMQYMI